MGKESDRMHAAKRISSGTVVTPRTSVLMVMGACLAVLAIAWYMTGQWPSAMDWFLLVLGSGLAAAIMGIATMGMVDEVWDLGDHLLVRKGGTQARIGLANILKAEASVNSSPERVTVFLVKPCVFGRQVAFRPVGRPRRLPGLRHPLAEELMHRAHQARTVPLSKAPAG